MHTIYLIAIVVMVAVTLIRYNMLDMISGLVTTSKHDNYLTGRDCNSTSKNMDISKIWKSIRLMQIECNLEFNHNMLDNYNIMIIQSVQFPDMGN
ncbi:hypothetical protein DERF_007063 [Dermatophagoides farinae]|uniref:Uncharacterized protein n=1 Tax=Dermatophagoides farinae TaxID=6954 RepID=A0A922L7K8_DERFA|nr:hypothetical protein DERF_007063 [Dermatophagoides farinae]